MTTLQLFNTQRNSLDDDFSVFRFLATIRDVVFMLSLLVASIMLVFQDFNLLKVVMVLAIFGTFTQLYIRVLFNKK
jgi:hypothetical protein